MEPYKQRMLEENIGLSGRLIKAEKFMQTDTFKTEMDRTGAELLYNQTLAMKLYRNLLRQRMDRLLTAEDKKEAAELRLTFIDGEA